MSSLQVMTSSQATSILQHTSAIDHPQAYPYAISFADGMYCSPCNKVHVRDDCAKYILTY